MTTLSVVTGHETQTGHSPQLQALIGFYHAFNHGDLELMAQNWANHDNIIMNNPLGGVIKGWQAIQAVYRRIFEGKASVYVEFYDYTLQGTDNLFFVAGRERGYFRTADRGQIDLAIRTSRIYQLLEGQWRQIHHHGSIDNPDLLAQYQKWLAGQ